jgi:hypothetical protein
MRDLVSPKWCKITLRLWGGSLGAWHFCTMVPFWQLTLFSLQRKKRKQQQDSDTFNFDDTAIIASSLAEIVGLFDTCYIDG